MYEALRSRSLLWCLVCISNARRKSVCAVDMRVFVCVVNLFFSFYKCVKISIFSVEIFSIKYTGNGRNHHL